MSSRRALVCAVILTALSTSASGQSTNATQGTFYAALRGWTVMDSGIGCTAFKPDVQAIFNTPPAGGWQLILPCQIPGDEGDFYASVDVDKVSFEDNAYGDGTYYYLSFPAGMRKTVGQGDNLSARIDGQTWDTALAGATAALLKVEECWTVSTGWSPQSSSRAGTFAFSDDPLGK